MKEGDLVGYANIYRDPENDPPYRLGSSDFYDTPEHAALYGNLARDFTEYVGIAEVRLVKAAADIPRREQP